MLLDHPRSEFGGDARRSRLPWPSKRTLLILTLCGVPLLFAGLQIIASRNGFEGPLASLWADYAGTPKSASVPWAGLALALVGLSWRHRMATLGAAVAIDACYAVLRVLLGGPLTVGNGPVIALTGLVLVAWLGWEGNAKRDALHAAALGALLVLATKVADVWLHVTVLAGPNVLDRYVLDSDRALGEPAWLMGRVLNALGPVVSAVLHWVYIELPVAAMVVAVWQLRHVVSSGRWPGHYLVRTFLTLGLLGPLVYVIFPVVGPAFAFAADGHGLQVGAYWPQRMPPADLLPARLSFDRFTPRNCMPSMHTAWATTVFLHSRRAADGSPAPRWLRWGGSFWLLATVAATLGFGYHYGSDLIAGFVLCLTVESALRDPGRGWDHARIELVVVGSALLAGLLLAYRFLAVGMATHALPAGLLMFAAVSGYAFAFYTVWFRRDRAEVPAVERIVAG